MNYLERLSPAQALDLMQDKEAFERRVAECNPAAYVTGLELATFAIRTKGLKLSDIDYDAYREQKDRLWHGHKAGYSEEFADNYLAFDLGIKAGNVQFLGRFTIDCLQK